MEHTNPIPKWNNMIAHWYVTCMCLWIIYVWYVFVRCWNWPTVFFLIFLHWRQLCFFLINPEIIFSVMKSFVISVDFIFYLWKRSSFFIQVSIKDQTLMELFFLWHYFLLMLFLLMTFFLSNFFLGGGVLRIKFDTSAEFLWYCWAVL